MTSFAECCDEAPPRDLHEGDVLFLQLAPRMPDGTPLSVLLLQAMTAKVEFFAPGRDPEGNRDDRANPDHEVDLTFDGLRTFTGRIVTANWYGPGAVSDIRWTARYRLIGDYARDVYYTFILKP